MKHKRDERGFHHIVLLMVVILLAAAGFTGYRVYKNNKSSPILNNGATTGSPHAMNNGCKGKGPGTITASPIALADLLYIQPIGLEIGGHVTPIDHGYFYIKGAQANPSKQAPVYAPFDGVTT